MSQSSGERRIFRLLSEGSLSHPLAYELRIRAATPQQPPREYNGNHERDRC